MSLNIDETTALAPGERAAGLSQRRAIPARAAALTTPGLVTVLIGAFLPMTDFFIVNVALPTIDRDLHASAGMLQLVVAGYALGCALLLVVGGRLGDGWPPREPSALATRPRSSSPSWWRTHSRSRP
jgi:MFS family permease